MLSPCVRQSAEVDCETRAESVGCGGGLNCGCADQSGVFAGRWVACWLAEWSVTAVVEVALAGTRCMRRDVCRVVTKATRGSRAAQMEALVGDGWYGKVHACTRRSAATRVHERDGRRATFQKPGQKPEPVAPATNAAPLAVSTQFGLEEMVCLTRQLSRTLQCIYSMTYQAMRATRARQQLRISKRRAV